MTYRKFRNFFVLSLLIHFGSYFLLSNIKKSTGFGPASIQKSEIQFEMLEQAHGPQSNEFSPPDVPKPTQKGTKVSATNSYHPSPNSPALSDIKRFFRQELNSKMKFQAPPTSTLPNLTKSNTKGWPTPERLNLKTLNFGPELKERAQFGLLNEDFERFHSFIFRTAEDIGGPWVQLIKAEARRLKLDSASAPPGGWKTRLDVVLDPTGQLKKIVLLKSSGVTDFDTAAEHVFYAKGFFPHPPKGMINEDGEIVLKYIFIVY